MSVQNQKALERRANPGHKLLFEASTPEQPKF
jgi:hypothetical protein